MLLCGMSADVTQQDVKTRCQAPTELMLMKDRNKAPLLTVTLAYVIIYHS